MVAGTDTWIKPACAVRLRCPLSLSPVVAQWRGQVQGLVHRSTVLNGDIGIHRHQPRCDTQVRKVSPGTPSTGNKGHGEWTRPCDWCVYSGVVATHVGQCEDIVRWDTSSPSCRETDTGVGRALNMRIPHGGPAVAGIFVVKVHGLSTSPRAVFAGLRTRPAVETAITDTR
jgi:hypothetical protein